MKQNRSITYLFRFSLFMLLLSGFGQMPIFKRYYLADIPGFSWLGEFYITHVLHYIFSILFIFFITYFGSLYIYQKKKIGAQLLIRGGIFAGLTVSGAILVLRNFPDYWFPNISIIVTDLVHLGFVMAFIVCSMIIFIYNLKTDSK